MKTSLEWLNNRFEMTELKKIKELEERAIELRNLKERIRN